MRTGSEGVKPFSATGIASIRKLYAQVAQTPCDHDIFHAGACRGGTVTGIVHVFEKFGQRRLREAVPRPSAVEIILPAGVEP